MSHPLAPSAKGWTTCSPRLSALISFITSPQGDSSYQNSPHTMAHDARYWQRCTTVQSIPRQPTRADPLMVSSPISQLCWQFQGPVRSFRGTILVLRSTQAEHQHFREAVWPSRTSSRGLQHGCCPTDLQAKHLLLQRWTTCLDMPTNIQCSKMTYEQPPMARKEVPNFRTGQGRPIEGRKGQTLETDPTKRDHNKRCVFHKEHGHTRDMQVPPLSG
ncbi:hypothetical protein AAG906_005801 [Vitis piasezkii]